MHAKVMGRARFTRTDGTYPMRRLIALESFTASSPKIFAEPDTFITGTIKRSQAEYSSDRIWLIVDKFFAGLNLFQSPLRHTTESKPWRHEEHFRKHPGSSGRFSKCTWNR
jgi:hypothetical protein